MTDNQYTAKLWLNRNYSLWHEIQQLKARREVLLCDINGGVSPYRVKETQNDTTKAQARAEDMRLSYSELCDLIDRRVKELNHADAETLDIISRLDDATERTLLTARHINYLTWAKIIKQTHWARASAFRYYNSALDKVYKEVYGDFDSKYKAIYVKSEN